MWFINWLIFCSHIKCRLKRPANSSHSKWISNVWKICPMLLFKILPLHVNVKKKCEAQMVSNWCDWFVWNEVFFQYNRFYWFFLTFRIHQQSSAILQYIQYVLFARFGHLASTLLAKIFQSEETHRLSAITLRCTSRFNKWQTFNLLSIRSSWYKFQTTSVADKSLLNIYNVLFIFNSIISHLNHFSPEKKSLQQKTNVNTIESKQKFKSKSLYQLFQIIM